MLAGAGIGFCGGKQWLGNLLMDDRGYRGHGWRGQKLCYNEGLPQCRARQSSAGFFVRRGVAQPGRAPGSGPGGRRFKSSLPDHLISNPKLQSLASNPVPSLWFGTFIRARFSRAGGRRFKPSIPVISFKVLRLRSGFRLAARTPSKRLKFKSSLPDHYLSSRQICMDSHVTCGPSPIELGKQVFT